MAKKKSYEQFAEDAKRIDHRTRCKMLGLSDNAPEEVLHDLAEQIGPIIPPYRDEVVAEDARNRPEFYRKAAELGLLSVHDQKLTGVKMTFKPHDLASLDIPAISKRRRTVEVISHPISHENGHQDTIMVRMVPGEPTTLQEVVLADLIPHLKHRISNIKHRWVHVARVTTGFCFPEDMLRYDGAALFDHTLPEQGEGGGQCLIVPKEGLIVYTTSTGKTKSPWTDARWQSFSAWLKPLYVRDLRDMSGAVINQ